MRHKHFLWVLFFVWIWSETRAFASVKLISRVNEAGQILNSIVISEDFVMFGKYPHRLKSPTGPQETEPTLILWRVMSLDNDVNPGKATLLSHYVLESMAYQSQDRDDGKDRNTWQGSEVQTWLNSFHRVPVKLRSSGNLKIKGFLHSDYFGMEEKDIMVSYKDGTDGKVTLPSGEADVSLGIFHIRKWPMSGELIEWFGTQSEQARRASFKGTVFDYSDSDNWWAYYWTRSPSIGKENAAWNVMKTSGFLIYHSTRDAVVGVRPVCVIDLSAILFKVPLSFISLDLVAADLAGSTNNPYLLYTSGDVQPIAVYLSGDVLSLDFAVELEPVGQWPDKSDFMLYSGPQSIPIVHVTSTDRFPKTLLLKLVEPALPGEHFVLAYNVSMDDVGTLFTSSGAVASRDCKIAMRSFTLEVVGKDKNNE